MVKEIKELKQEIKRIKHDKGDRIIWSILPNTSTGINNWNEQEIKKRRLEIKLIKLYAQAGVRF